MNVILGRAVLDHISAHPGQFDMCTFGEETACGTVACLAGRAMLLSGYTLRGEIFHRPDGEMVLAEAAEAEQLLDIKNHPRLYEGNGPVRGYLFVDFRQERALGRFRAMVEHAEAEAAGGPGEQ